MAKGGLCTLFRSKLSILLVAVLVLNFFTTTHCLQGTLWDRVVLREDHTPGATIITTLPAQTVVIILCRVQDSFVFDDPWWLKVFVPSAGLTGWVPDYDVYCGTVGNCVVPIC